MQVALEVRGMRCGSCAAKVTEALETLSGVLSATISVEEKRAFVITEEDLDPNTLCIAASVGGEFEVAILDANAPIDVVQSAERHESLFPLFLIVAFIAGTTLLVGVATNVWSVDILMRHFMAGFFLVFAFFKFLDLRGFSASYGNYDLIAKHIPAWGIAYPFVELGLAVAYLLGLAPLVTNSLTLLLMLVGSLGVLQALRAGRALPCACLGTALNLPMTKVTLIEDLAMAFMAGAMLLM